ncbi:MAG: diaminopimelate epimerase [Coriobacteriales bacterium]|jgi:diaminopimelate epimerase|nr:diaminopimelate epimerase [Coriobacteriales bacterium]
MLVDFEKIHGAGNDFIIIDDPECALELSPQHVGALCDRHFGIGADGIILARSSPNPDCVSYMHYINADGSLAEMCGNGVRCFAKHLVDHGVVPVRDNAGSLIADTLAGPRSIDFEFRSNAACPTDSKAGGTARGTDASNVPALTKCGSMSALDFWATVDMGEPRFSPKSIPTTLDANQEIDILHSNLGDKRSEPAVVRVAVPLPTMPAMPATPISLTCVNMGNPHAVIFLEDVDDALAQTFAADPTSLDINELGRFLESSTGYFPEKTNVEFAVVTAKNTITMRVFERGVGETLACGTGACATAVAAAVLRLVGRSGKVSVELPGGVLQIRWLPDNHVLLTGPAQTVFTGSIEL